MHQRHGEVEYTGRHLGTEFNNIGSFFPYTAGWRRLLRGFASNNPEWYLVPWKAADETRYREGREKPMDPSGGRDLCPTTRSRGGYITIASNLASNRAFNMIQLKTDDRRPKSTTATPYEPIRQRVRIWNGAHVAKRNSSGGG